MFASFSCSTGGEDGRMLIRDPGEGATERERERGGGEREREREMDRYRDRGRGRNAMCQPPGE